jgi:DNA-binding IclR family transcriptional regulator
MASLTQVADVLRCFTRSTDPLTVTQVSEQLGLHKSTLSRLLRAMRDAGFLEQAEGSRGYGRGGLWHEMAVATRGSESFDTRASAAVRRLADALGHSGFVSVRSGTSMIGVVHHLGTNPIQVSAPIGVPLPIDACATGRAMLAEMSDAQVRELLGNEVSRASPQSPASMDELLQRLARVRTLGYAESADEVGTGVGALAVAVRDPDSGREAALCVTYATTLVPAEERAHALQLLLQARAQVSTHHHPTTAP